MNQSKGLFLKNHTKLGQQDTGDHNTAKINNQINKRLPNRTWNALITQTKKEPFESG